MGIQFGTPPGALPVWILASAGALALLALALRHLEQRRRARLERFAEAGLIARLLPGYDPRVRRPLSVLAILGFAFIALALLQPQWGFRWQELRQVSRDVLIVLDTSESMRAEDILPSRLERSKQEVSALLERAPADRFGLIAFAGAAALQCPITLDHAYFRAVLNAVDTNTISRKGTDIAAALGEARAILEQEQARNSDYDRNARAVLLISDGEDISNNAVEAAENLAKVARVYVIGVGDPNGAIIRMPGWMTQYRGASSDETTHVSRLDEDTLMRIAAAGGGAYTRSQVDAWDTEQLYNRFRDLAAREVSGELRMRMINRYQWPLLAAILCFTGEGLWLCAMPWLRRRRIARAAREGDAHA